MKFPVCVTPFSFPFDDCPVGIKKACSASGPNNGVIGGFSCPDAQNTVDIRSGAGLAEPQPKFFQFLTVYCDASFSQPACSSSVSIRWRRIVCRDDQRNSADSSFIYKSERADGLAACSPAERSGGGSLLRDVPEKLPSWPAWRLDEVLPYRRQAAWTSPYHIVGDRTMRVHRILTMQFGKISENFAQKTNGRYRKHRSESAHFRKKWRKHWVSDMTRHIWPEEEYCPACGGDLRPQGCDVSVQLELISSVFLVIETQRPKLVCFWCDHIVQMQVPSKPLERNYEEAVLLAQIAQSGLSSIQVIYY